MCGGRTNSRTPYSNEILKIPVERPLQAQCNAAGSAFFRCTERKLWTLEILDIFAWVHYTCIYYADVYITIFFLPIADIMCHMYRREFQINYCKPVLCSIQRACDRLKAKGKRKAAWTTYSTYTIVLNSPTWTTPLIVLNRPKYTLFLHVYTCTFYCRGV